ncbi:6715_t:CDS:2, partial [Paraglomus occultum]
SHLSPFRTIDDSESESDAESIEGEEKIRKLSQDEVNIRDE